MISRFVLILLLLSSTASYAEDTAHEKLMIFEPFMGTWKAVFNENTTDVNHIAWILGGEAIRIMHSINDGDYGGEALVQWNTGEQAITYQYVTTATFYTRGTVTPTENGFEAHEIVHGNMDGITETRAGYTMKDGEFHVWSQYLKDGEWTEKSQATYVKAPDAKVKFKDK